MDNIKGDYLLQLGREEWRISYSINSICDLEKATGLTVVEISKQLQNSDKISLSFVRAFLWSGLRKHHSITLEECGELIQKYGLQIVMDQLVLGFSSAFPDADPNANPTMERKRQDGNGTSSLSTGSNAV